MHISSKKLLQQVLLQATILFQVLSPSVMQAYDADDSMEQPSERSHQIPEFTPFDWSAQPSYIIEGTVCSNVAGAGITICSPVVFVIDPPNKRMLFDLGAQGKYYMFEDASYITGVFPFSTKVIKPDGTNYTFADQVAGYKTVVAMENSTTEKSNYFGLAKDVGGCRDSIAVEFYLKDGFLSKFNFTQLYPLPGLGCASVTGCIKFKKNSIDTHSCTDPYFVLPADANDSSPSFCATAYPTGNPCDLCPSCQ